METPLKYTKEEIEGMLSKLEDDETYGIVLRTKGVVPSTDDHGSSLTMFPESPM